MSIQLQPPVPLVTLVKTEPPTVIKNEPPEEALEEEISTDMKDLDVVYHPLCENLIKSETVLENKHLESVQSQVLVKAENSPFIKTENKTETNKYEATGNVSRGTGQGVVEVQASNGHSNALSNLETDEQSVLNFSKTLNGISVRSRKSKSSKKTDFAACYKTDVTTLWEKEKEKIKVIKAPVIPVEAHEYTSLAKDRHVCNHCQYAYNALSSLKLHIKRMHREVTTMYQCPYCPYKPKWSLRDHIIRKHKNTKDIQWLQCHLCEKKFKLKSDLTRHKKVHLTHEQMQHRLDLKRHDCDTCDYKTYRLEHLKRHNLVHLKPEEIEYFYCYHCSYKCQRKDRLKLHIFRHFKNVEFKEGKRYGCNECGYETYNNTHFNSHKLTHLKPEEIQYFHCYHCSHKSKQKANLKNHIFRHHFKNVKRGKGYHCDKCEYKTYTSTILKNHKLTHLKPEEIQYFYCYHCSYKSAHKKNLNRHIFSHFRNENVPFHCYICDFVTQKRDLIIQHIRKHFKNRNKYDETISKYQLESHINNLKKRFPNNLEDHCSTIPFDDHVNHIKNQKSEQPESTKAFVSRTKSVPENSSNSCTTIHFDDQANYIKKEKSEQPESTKSFVLRTESVPETSSKSCSAIHFDDHVNYIKKEKSEQPESTKSFVSRTESVPQNLSKSCSTIHCDDHVNYIKKQKSEQPESTESFFSRAESVPENSSKSCILQCTYCPTKFPEEHLLKGHLQLHSSNKGIECPICTYRHNKTEILKHVSWHGANGNDSFICPICDLNKRTKENMDDHLKVVHSKAIYQKHDSVCKKKSCNGFCQITIGGKVGAE